MTKRVLVTGGSKGIGLAIAQGLAADGHDVAVFSRTPPPGEGLVHLAGDLRDPESVRRAIRPWVADGPVDALFHSAVAYGSDGRHPFLDSTVEEWDAALQVNARGLMLTLQAVLQKMIARDRGLVVGISSDIATRPGPGRIPYAASKSAARAIMIGLAEEVAGSGVCVLELMPTQQVDTPGIRSRRPPDFEPVGYADAGSFVSPAKLLLTRNMTLHHGTCLLVEPDGRLLDAHGGQVR